MQSLLVALGELGGVQNIPPVAPFPNLYLGAEGTFNDIPQLRPFRYLLLHSEQPAAASREVKKVSSALYILLGYLYHTSFGLAYGAYSLSTLSRRSMEPR